MFTASMHMIKGLLNQSVHHQALIKQVRTQSSICQVSMYIVKFLPSKYVHNQVFTKVSQVFAASMHMAKSLLNQSAHRQALIKQICT